MSQVWIPADFVMFTFTQISLGKVETHLFYSYHRVTILNEGKIWIQKPALRERGSIRPSYPQYTTAAMVAIYSTPMILMGYKIHDTTKLASAFLALCMYFLCVLLLILIKLNLLSLGRFYTFVVFQHLGNGWSI